MNRYFATVLFVTLILGACSRAASPPAQSPTSAGATREAILSEVQSQVSVRASADQAPLAASNRDHILPNGSVETGDQGKVRITLMPEGTIVRLAPNSSFTLTSMTTEAGAPITRVQLLFGKLFVLLKGGSLEVETPSGVASVRGSLLSVSYDAEKSRIEADCLEGTCSLTNENGDEVDLSDGQFSYIEGDEMPPSDAAEMDRAEVQDWLDENPDLGDFLDQLPDPENFPEEIDQPTDEPEATEPPNAEPPP